MSGEERELFKDFKQVIDRTRKLRVTVHIAGAVDGTEQRCTRCGIRIDAGDGAMTMDGIPPRSWAPGAFVGMGDGFATVMDHDARLALNEIKCSAEDL